MGIFLDKLRERRIERGFKRPALDLGGSWEKTRKDLARERAKNKQESRRLRGSILTRPIKRLIRALNKKDFIGATIERDMPDKNRVRYITKDRTGNEGYVELAIVPSIFRNNPPRYLLDINGKEHPLVDKQEFEELRDYLERAKKNNQDS